MSRVFAQSNHAYRVYSRFLASYQEKKELSDYVQEFWTLLAAMQLNPFAEAVKVTIFMERLRTGTNSTKSFHKDDVFNQVISVGHPQNFGEAMRMFYVRKHEAPSS